MVESLKPLVAMVAMVEWIEAAPRKASTLMNQDARLDQIILFIGGLRLCNPVGVRGLDV